MNYHSMQHQDQSVGQSMQPIPQQQMIDHASYLPMYYATSALNSPPAMSAFPFISSNFESMNGLSGPWSNGAYDTPYTHPTQSLHDYGPLEHGYPASPTLSSSSGNQMYQPNMPLFYPPSSMSSNDYWPPGGIPMHNQMGGFNSFQAQPIPYQEKQVMNNQNHMPNTENELEQVTQSFNDLKTTEIDPPVPEVSSPIQHQEVPAPSGVKSWAAIASAPAKPRPKPKSESEPGIINYSMPANKNVPNAQARQQQVRWGRGRGQAPYQGPDMNSIVDTKPPPPPAVLDELRSKNQYNPRDMTMDLKNCRFFIIKSYSEDDIHRSIKYNIWTSTEHGNKRLNEAWNDSKQGKGGPIYLIYSVNGSGHFCGVAEMCGNVDTNICTGVWSQDKWKGKFDVKWIYVKDVPNNLLRHIKLENNDNKPVTNSRDTQEVPKDKGLALMKIVHDYKHSTSIFDDFGHYEKRQDEDNARKGISSDKQSKRPWEDKEKPRN